MSDYQAKQDDAPAKFSAKASLADLKAKTEAKKTDAPAKKTAAKKKDDAPKKAPKKRAAAKKKDEPATADDATKSVSATISAIHSDVLDQLRQSTSRPDYVSAVVARHLEAANPVGSVTEDDELPGNEREVKSPVFRV